MFSALALRLRVRVALALLTAALLCLGATPGARALAVKLGAIDRPGESRRVNDRPVPRLGGLAIYLGFLVGAGLFSPMTEAVRGVLLGSALIAALGAADDLWDLNAWAKLGVECLAALIAVHYGAEIRLLTNPVLSTGEGIALGALSVPVTVLWIVGVTNAMNLIDGLDGLAAGLAAIACASMLAVSLFVPEATDVSVLLAALGGACLGFLPYNRNPARIFMGDTGSLLLGYVLSAASVIGLFKSYTIVSLAVPLLAMALPLFDTVFAVVRRVRHGESPMKADRGHIHHRLLALGLSQKQAVAVLYALSGIFGVAAVMLAASGAVRLWLLLLSGLIALAAWLYVFSRKKENK